MSNPLLAIAAFLPVIRRLGLSKARGAPWILLTRPLSPSSKTRDTTDTKFLHLGNVREFQAFGLFSRSHLPKPLDPSQM